MMMMMMAKRQSDDIQKRDRERAIIIIIIIKWLEVENAESTYPGCFSLPCRECSEILRKRVNRRSIGIFTPLWE